MSDISDERLAYIQKIIEDELTPMLKVWDKEHSIEGLIKQMGAHLAHKDPKLKIGEAHKMMLSIVGASFSADFAAICLSLKLSPHSALSMGLSIAQQFKQVAVEYAVTGRVEGISDEEATHEAPGGLQ